MTNDTILRKALEKVIENGWKAYEDMMDSIAFDVFSFKEDEE